MYSDVIKKSNFYKEKIVNEYIKQGIYPNNALISKRLNNIDCYTALFKKSLVDGNFDVDEYNYNLKMIEKDLTFLYELLYELTVKKYEMLKCYVDAHAEELERKSEFYLNKINEEVNSSSLGNTLLFEKELYPVCDNGIMTMYCGQINAYNGSKLGCFISTNSNLKPEDVLFTIYNDKEKYVATAYNYNTDTININGTTEISEKEVIIDKDQQVNFPLLISNNDKYNILNSYVILGGKKKIAIKSEENQELKILDIGTAIHIDNRSYIEFYTYNAKTVSFTFNKKPLSANFNTDTLTVDNVNKIHRFSLECDDDFTFSITLDSGNIFAFKEKAVYNDNGIYLNTSTNIRDFTLIELIRSSPKTYNVNLMVYNQNELPDINHVSVKELSFDDLHYSN